MGQYLQAGLDAQKLTTAPVNFIKLSDTVSKEVVQNSKFNKLNTKINDLENKTPDGSNLI